MAMCHRDAFLCVPVLFEQLFDFDPKFSLDKIGTVWHGGGGRVLMCL